MPEANNAPGKSLEEQIEDLLVNEKDAMTLYNALFQQKSGLFPRLAPTTAERKKQIQTELFTRAKAHVSRMLLAQEQALRETLKL